MEPIEKLETVGSEPLILNVNGMSALEAEAPNSAIAAAALKAVREHEGLQRNKGGFTMNFHLNFVLGA